MLCMLYNVRGIDFVRLDALYCMVRTIARTDRGKEARERCRRRFVEVLAYLVDKA